jgi:hypothetical protein
MYRTVLHSCTDQSFPRNGDDAEYADQTVVIYCTEQVQNCTTRAILTQNCDDAEYADRKVVMNRAELAYPWGYHAANSTLSKLK